MLCYSAMSQSMLATVEGFTGKTLMPAGDAELGFHLNLAALISLFLALGLQHAEFSGDQQALALPAALPMIP